MGLDAELYTCQKDELDIEKVFMYNGFIVTNSNIYSNPEADFEEDLNNIDNRVQEAFIQYGEDLTDDLEVISESLMRDDFYLFSQVYRELIDNNAFINGCFTVVTIDEMKVVLAKIKDEVYKEGVFDELQDLIYVKPANTFYLFRADW